MDFNKLYYTSKGGNVNISRQQFLEACQKVWDASRKGMYTPYVDDGWDCPESLDKVCHYYSVNGMVKLNNGKEVKMPESHDPTMESEDWCIFCGEPEERK